MEKKMRCYEVSVYFEGVMKYTIEAANEKEAKSRADALFAEESGEIVLANVAQTTTTVDMEATEV